MYKVFVNDKPICLVDANFKTELTDGDLLVDIGTAPEIAFPIEVMEKEKSVIRLVLLSDDVEKTLQDFKNQFENIEAAGGMVYNSNGELLVIKRNGRWDLPKGKVESGESIENAAVREVTEECGVTNLKITSPLPATYHLYTQNEKRILKITHWFKMETTFSGTLQAQTEEGITETKWISKASIEEITSNTYGNIQDLINAHL